MQPKLVPPAVGQPALRQRINPRNFARRLLLPAALFALTAQTSADVAPQMFGVNLSGGEANADILPGVFNTHYVYPLAEELEYYRVRNLNMVRFPILWERIQNPLNSALIESEMARIDQVIGYARTRGMKVILDVHNYNVYKIGGTSYQVGSPQVPHTAFANLWSRLADRYKNDHAIYGYDLMNEPGGTLANWQAAAQAAVNAIRAVDTKHWILVEGVNWSGAQSWRTSNNTLSVTDSANRLIYSAHSYWSPTHNDLYVTYTTPRDHPMMGVDQLEPFIEWIKEHGYNGHIGEYGVPTTPEVTAAEAALWNTVLENALNYMEDNGVSGTYWAGGRWMAGGAYILGCQPSPLTGAEKPVMTPMKNHPGELVFEAERLATASFTDPVTIFADAAASYGEGEKLAANAVGDQITYTVPVPLSGNYTVKVGAKRYSSLRGRFQLAIDGVNQGAVQDQHGSSAFVEYNLGNKNLTAGNKAFRFTVAGTSSAGYELTFDYVKLDPVAPTLVQVTVDNTNATFTGTWNSAYQTEGFFNVDYFHDGNTAKGKTARFTPNLPSAGNYSVYGRWVGSGTSRAASVPVDILHAGVLTPTTINQQVGGGTWVLIGTYNFNAGTGGYVELKTQGTAGFVIADAIRFIRQ